MSYMAIIIYFLSAIFNTATTCGMKGLVLLLGNHSTRIFTPMNFSQANNLLRAAYYKTNQRLSCFCTINTEQFMWLSSLSTHLASANKTWFLCHPQNVSMIIHKVCARQDV